MEKLLKEEKKVEYLELIYDLIFVYVIGRNNTLLHHIGEADDIFPMFAAYVLCTLAVIQIWNFTTYYINMHGRNGIRDHIFLFVNMYLLYYIAQGTRINWESYQFRYHMAWGLILINLGMQYVIEIQAHRDEPHIRAQLRHMAVVLFGEALIVFCGIPVYSITGKNLLALPAVVFGIAASMIHRKHVKVILVDFAHLSERVMLYVVFSFGEMIIALSGYFEDTISVNNFYFSVMSFLVAVGLFLCYGMMYDKILDREISTTGLGFMMIHIFLIFALNNITISLEFMHDEDVSLLPKITFLIVSLLMFYASMLSLTLYSKKCIHITGKNTAVICLTAVCFSALMFLLRENMYLNIALTVVYTFGLFLTLVKVGRSVNAAE